MKPSNPRILTINRGSSSIEFALFEEDDSLRRILGGEIDRIGLPEATFRVKVWKIEPKPETKPEVKPEAKAEPIAEDKDKAPSDLTPQLVKRVHELCEDLGRKEVQEVEEWEKAKRKTS